MNFDIQTIFIPSVGVDIIFNLSSPAPYSRSSIIYDADYKKNTLTIAQTLVPLTADTQFKELHISTIVTDKNRKMRVGLPCLRFKNIPAYRLAGGKTTQAILLAFDPYCKEINIRSSYRLPIGARHQIKGRLVYRNFEFISERDFNIRDISLTGISLLIPKKTGKILHTLNEMEKGQELLMHIELVETEKTKTKTALSIKSQVARRNPDHSPDHLFYGLKFLKLRYEDEDRLNKFIHEAQIDELKRLSGRNL